MTGRNEGIAAQCGRDQRHSDTVSKNMTIKDMAKKGSTVAEIMIETGMGKNYVRRIAGRFLK